MRPMGHVIKRILTKYQFYKPGGANLRLELSLEVHEAYYLRSSHTYEK